MSSSDETAAVAEKVFKGATRPAMMAGVPYIPFIVLTLGGALCAVWLLAVNVWASLAGALLTLGVYVWMRHTTQEDDQALLQWVLRLRLGMRQSNRRFWRAHVYSPIRFKKQWQKY